ncbi:GerAB/ArcD/ProY family transporter [Paucisalibacillus globulus]|uniref:GerAB/ArcD/ProY family transporter n=1 Tax=Paucisalibacillus globulus TaxID=351095 RepID=UPI0003F59C7D|nr:endospore germination permease [Paucisalibacillus globulus]
MEESKGKIGLKEFIVLTIIMIGTKVADDTPAILFESLHNAGWMAPLINGIIAIIPIYLLIKVVTSYDRKGLIHVTNDLFGKFFGFSIVFILWVFLFSALIIDTAIYADIITSVYYIKTPTIIIYGVLMLVCAYGAKRGLEQIGSVAYLTYPYLQLTFFIALLLTITQGNVHFLFPLFGPGGWEVLKESALKLSIYGDLLYLFILIPYISSTKNFKKGTWIAFIIIVLNLTIAMASYVFFFDYNSVMELNYPYHEVIRTITGGFLTNLETFFFPFWIIASIVRFAIYLYLTAILFGHLFKIKHFEYVIPTLATLIVFIGVIPESTSSTIFQLRQGLLSISTPVFFFLPCLMWLVAKLKGVTKK